MYRQYGTADTDWGTLTADTMLNREPVMNLKGKWEYEDGLMLDGMYAVYQQTQKPAYLRYIQSNLERYIAADGAIKGYAPKEWQLDHINNGKILLKMYEETGDPKYKLAADRLYHQLEHQPRTPMGTFWHKDIYPNQVWLDGVYMADVFYAQYLKLIGAPDFIDVSSQFLNAYAVTVDRESGLCYHAFDASRRMYWADAKSGCSPHFWLRAMGWFAMAMVDVQEYLPDGTDKTHINLNLSRLLQALRKVADPATNLWYQIPDQGDRPLNYLESSGSLMVLAAIAKATRLGYLPDPQWDEFLAKGWQNALTQFITITNDGNVNVNKIAYVGGLGGATRRDGSYAYYMSEPIVANDHKGVGPMLLLAAEMAQRK